MKSTFTSPVPADTPETSFRLLLRAELAARCSRNSSYSLRALARDVGVDHSTLSQLMRGRRRLTERTIRELGAALGLPEERVDRYVAAERLRAADVVARRQMDELTSAAAEVIAEWHHFAILELVHLQEFRPDVRWIARVLDLSTDNVVVAVNRLLRLELLRMEAPDRWVDLTGDAAVDLESFGRLTLERLERKVRRLAAPSGAGVSTLREHSATTIAVSTRRIPEARERIARLWREVVELLGADGEADDVYRLEIDLYPVTRLQDAGASADGPADRHGAPAEHPTRTERPTESPIERR